MGAPAQVNGVNLMRVLGSSNHHYFRHHLREALLSNEFQPLLSVVPTATSVHHGTAHAWGSRGSPYPSDAVLKCLDRDDPLRHTYLRRRWQAP